ncbi:AAA domain-containing protein [Nostoc sp.]|uniref:AAA domain-containing protein n=1 Tax=Nostoc sp. TaxID=1180 RepID=UPI002FF6A414
MYLNRYQHFVQDWIGKLRQPTEGDACTGLCLRTDLKRIYLNNANVVGITCVQAAKRDFSEEFKYFDVVIIDEVSKCTLPELLIPALKGKKIVMVGDHRQLPPMLDTKTLEEVSQEIGSTNTEL